MSPAAALAVALVVIAGVACDGDDAAAPSTSARATSPSATSPGTTEAPAAGTTTTASDRSSTTSTTETTTSSSSTGTSGPQVLGPLGSNEVQIDTDEGSVQIGSGTIPPTAAAVPAPADLRVELATEASGSAGYSGTSQQSVAELGDFYAAALPAAGFEITEDRPAGSSRFIAFRRDDGVGQIAISEEPGGSGSTVIVAYGPPA